MIVCIRHGMREKVMFLLSCDAFLGMNALPAQVLRMQMTAEKLGTRGRVPVQNTREMIWYRWLSVAIEKGNQRR